MRICILFLILVTPFLIKCGKKVDPCQPANAGPNKAIKIGESIEIGANDSIDGVTYDWMPASFVKSPTSAKTLVSPSQTTVYLLRLKNSCAVSFDYVKVIVQ